MERENRAEQNKNLEQHSYEEFTQRPFYIAINRETVRKAPDKCASILDIATGTGGIIETLISEKKVDDIGFIVGIDIDQDALEEAKKKVLDKRIKLSPAFGSIEFNQGNSEQIDKPDDMFELITFCNAIHLTDVPKSMKEVYRVLKPGGTFVANSAFVDGIGYPTPEAELLWRSLGSRAVRKVMKEGLRPEKNTDFVTLTKEDYVRIANETGFTDIKTSLIEANMDRDDVLAICHYDEFARGALKGIPLEIAHKALAESANEIFESLKEKGEPEVFPRNWMVLTAKKPE